MPSKYSNSPIGCEPAISLFQAGVAPEENRREGDMPRLTHLGRFGLLPITTKTASTVPIPMMSRNSISEFSTRSRVFQRWRRHLAIGSCRDHSRRFNPSGTVFKDTLKGSHRTPLAMGGVCFYTNVPNLYARRIFVNFIQKCPQLRTTAFLDSAMF
jgi:hypothetical protein